MSQDWHARFDACLEHISFSITQRRRKKTKTLLNLELLVFFLRKTQDSHPSAIVFSAAWLNSNGHVMNTHTSLCQYPIGWVWEDKTLHFRKWRNKIDSFWFRHDRPEDSLFDERPSSKVNSPLTVSPVKKRVNQSVRRIEWLLVDRVNSDFCFIQARMKNRLMTHSTSQNMS
jgi:hypothetical protein